MTGGGGSVTGASVTADTAGFAQVGSWTLGTTAGINELTATSAGLTGSPLTFTATGTYLTSYQVAFTPGGAFVNRRNTIFNPLTFKSRAAVAWNRGPFDARLQWSFVNGYRNINVNPVQKVKSYSLFDLNLGWDLNETFDLPGERLVLGVEVRNLFDQDPPYVNVLPNGNSAGGYDVTVADPIGRQFAVSLRAAF